jgi:cytochrome c5
MNRSCSAVAYAAAIAASVVLFAVVRPWQQGGASTAAEAAQLMPPPSTVSVGGVTLRSVTVDFPNRDRQFEGLGADVVNNNCLTCHSAGMILTQPRLPRAVWQVEVEKMRDTFKATVDAEDVPAIVDFLAKLPH